MYQKPNKTKVPPAPACGGRFIQYSCYFYHCFHLKVVLFLEIFSEKFRSCVQDQKFVKVIFENKFCNMKIFTKFSGKRN